MSRAKRLLDLIQILRSHKYPVTGAYLAGKLGVSLRTLYRDIGTLQEQGAPIEGEAGLGYVLRSGFMLPPLMFSEEEIEALVLGVSWVAERGDTQLGAASRRALTKISAVLPDDLRHILDETSLLIGTQCVTSNHQDVILPDIRQAIRTERKLKINYRDLSGNESCRVIWPFALGYFEHVRVLVAWCETRNAFRHFRTDRILTLDVVDQRYPRRRLMLLKEWRAFQGFAPHHVVTADKN